MTYECHITSALEGQSSAPLAAFLALSPWSFSRIADDPQLGPGTRAYATCYFETEAEAIHQTKAMADLLRAHGYPVLRAKVEHIVYDTHMSTGIES
jgi:hypothetical protein